MKIPKWLRLFIETGNTRYCSSCSTIKSRGEFYKVKGVTNYRCISCQNSQHRSSYVKKTTRREKIRKEKFIRLMNTLIEKERIDNDRRFKLMMRDVERQNKEYEQEDLRSRTSKNGKVFPTKEALETHIREHMGLMLFYEHFRDDVKMLARERKNAKARLSPERKAEFLFQKNKKSEEAKATERERQRWRDIKKRMRGKAKGCRQTPDLIERKMIEQKGICNGCLRPLQSFHVDHFFPISKGGSHEYDNLQLLCPTCNISKSDMLPLQWLFVKDSFIQ